MTGGVGHRVGLWVLTVSIVCLGGCAGKGEVVNLDLTIKPMAQEVASDETVKIVVEPLQDQRPDQTRLGIRTHLTGGATYFSVPGNKTGEAVARTLADYLRHKGWQVGFQTAGLAPTEGKTDILMSGTIRNLWATAKSRFFSTKMEVKSSIVVRAQNNVDGSVESITLDGAASDTVWFFTQAKLQDLVNAVLKDSYHKLIMDTRIENRAWRPRE
ncbi:MAG: hypothetical protein AB7G48_02905 [Nitrospiraceae bacterium]